MEEIFKQDNKQPSLQDKEKETKPRLKKEYEETETD